MSFLFTILLTCSCYRDNNVKAPPYRSGSLNAIISAPLIAQVGEEIVLQANVSGREGERPLAFQWRVVLEPALGAARLSSTSTATTRMVAATEGIYRLQLKVSDDRGSELNEYELLVEQPEKGLPGDGAFPEDGYGLGSGEAGGCIHLNEYEGTGDMAIGP